MLRYHCCLFFFFKQKTAYEMRISDWSSDVCSSDLQQIVGELDVGLVDFIDQQHRLRIGFERLPQFALDDVVADVAHLLVPELRVAQARDRVVLVRSEERRVGKECVSKCRPRWSPYH